jgi:hypothetical protein
VSDALAGVVFGLTMRREIWAHYGVQAVQLPSQIREVLQAKKKDNLKTEEVA